MLFLTAFLTGLFGSFHCAGMCGPIAFALPGKKQEGIGFYTGRLIYNSGRILTYSLLGVLSGAFGLGLKLAGWQQGISIAAGIVILVIVVYKNYLRKGIAINPFSWLSSGTIKKLFSSGSHQKLLTIGVLNGFLPCGFVYIAVLGASVTQSFLDGALFMVCFGLGTLPMMFGVSVAGQFISSGVRSRLSKLSPVFAIIIACLFIVRGLNLGIPYLSPKISGEQSEVKNCQ